MSKSKAFENFSLAIQDLANELNAEEVRVFRDDDDSFSAHIMAVGSYLPRHAEEKISHTLYTLNLCQTYGKDCVDVLVDHGSEAVTGETRLLVLQTKCSDVIDPILAKLGLSVYVERPLKKASNV